MGYDTETRSVNSLTKVLNVPLLTHNEILDDVVVTAGRFEQRSTDVTVSMEVLKPQALRSQAPTDLSSTLQTLPGVEIIDKQPSIRGGGGWTYSVGSRCQVLMDGMSITSDNLTTPSATMTTEELAKWAVQSFDMEKVKGYYDQFKSYTDGGMPATDAIVLTFQEVACL